MILSSTLPGLESRSGTIIDKKETVKTVLRHICTSRYSQRGEVTLLVKAELCT